MWHAFSMRPRRSHGPMMLCGLLTVAGGQAQGQSSCAAPDFANPVSAAVGASPRSLAVGDFDRDGKLDVATANASSATVTVRFGNGSGGFLASPVTTVSTGLATEPVALVALDLDRNGTLDLAVAVRTAVAGTVLPLLGNGAGALTPGTPVAVSLLPVALASGDFNRDGIQDVVVSHELVGSLQVLLGTGAGGFASGGSLLTGVLLGGLVARDFDRDGRLDVAVGTTVTGIVVAKGNGAGGFSGSANFGTGLLVAAKLAAGDVDGDGDQDLVAADVTGSNLSVLLNDGSGSFGPPSLVTTPLSGHTSVALGDFDRDGRLDAAITNGGSFQIDVGLGNGAGSFGVFVPFSVGADALTLALADFNGDGRLDLAAADGASNQATLLMNKSGMPCQMASFARAGRMQVPLGGNPIAIASGDWNGDGNPDLATAGNSALSVMLGDGKLGFGAATNLSLPFAASARQIAVADFNLDGAPDLLVVNPGTGNLTLFLNSGGFGLGTNLAISAQEVVARDFDGDGAPDIVAVGTQLSFARGGGNGTFAAPSSTPLGFSGSALAAADIDGDGTLDLAVTDQVGGQVLWLFGDGGGAFSGAGWQPVGAAPVAVALGDLDGDGRPDLVVTNRDSNDVSVLRNTAGAFAPGLAFAVGTSPRSIQIADTDGDNDADLVVADYGSDDVTVLLGNGAGSFPAARKVPGFRQPQMALVFDADRNGKPDLAVPTWPWSGSLLVLPADGNGGFGPEQVAPDTGFRYIVSGDFDRDGRIDLVTLDNSSNVVAFAHGQGNGTFATPVLFSTGLANAQEIVAADFNRDGALDVVAGSSFSGQTALLAGNGAGSFGLPTLTTLGGSTAGLWAADFDRDGIPDLAKCSGFANALAGAFGDGTGGFVSPFTLGVGTSPAGIAALDYDRDGISDLAVANYNSDTISVLRGSANRTTPFAVGLTLVTGDGPAGSAAADFDQDGFTDLVVSHGNSTTVGYFRGAAAGTFAARQDYAAGDQPDRLAAADVNGDGWLDLVVANRGGSSEQKGAVLVLLGTGSQTPGSAFQALDTWAVGQRTVSRLIAADFDGDAWPDFASSSILSGVSTAVAVVLNSNCESRRLRSTREPTRCNLPGTPFAAQPRLQIEDDGANPIQCDFAPVMTQLVPGTPGATLTGTNPLAPTAGVADWGTAPSPFSIDLPGNAYRLEYAQTPAGGTFSRSLSVQPSAAITGPAEFCRSASATFSAAPGFDGYHWELDGSPLQTFLASLSFPGASFSAGAHTLRLNAIVDTCPATDLRPFLVDADLASVTLSPGGPFSVCANCSGPTVGAAEAGGGPITARRWGYRLGAAFPVTFIPGQTAAAYTIQGAHFPGAGTYELIEESTPTCGPVTRSSPVIVEITAPTGGGNEVRVLTATATSTQNRLEWVNPAGFGNVRVRFNQHSTWLGCTPPADPSSDGTLLADQLGPVGGKDALLHTILANDTTYCYSVFVELSAGVWSAPRSIRSRPFDNAIAGAPSWAFSNGSASMSPPGLGPGILHATSNDGHVYAALKAVVGTPGAGGSWPTAWRPFELSGPSQSRPSTVPIVVGPASNVIYLGSQAGALLAVDADRGQGLWLWPTPPSVQAGPAGMFAAFGGAHDMILAGTREGVGVNSFHSVDPFSGNELAGWPYVGEIANEIGMVSSQATVRYATRRAYFTSYAHVPGTTDSVWCVDLDTAARCAGWPANGTATLGDVAAGPALRTTPAGLAGRLYVAPIDGSVHALDAANGDELWLTPFSSGGDGAVKSFVLPDTQSGDLYFSTVGTVWALTDTGSGFTPKWSHSMPSPSQPVFFASTGRVWVGAGNGRLYLLSASNGATITSFTLGDGLAAVGAPTVDQAGGFVYVGTDAGVVYAVPIP